MMELAVWWFLVLPHLLFQCLAASERHGSSGRKSKDHVGSVQGQRGSFGEVLTSPQFVIKF